MWSSTFQTIGRILNKCTLKHVILGEVYAREVIVNNLENQPFFGQKATINFLILTSKWIVLNSVIMFVP